MDSSFLIAKVLREIRPVSRNAGGVGQNRRLLTKTGFISKTVQDRRIVFIQVEQEVVYAPSNGGIAHDLDCFLTTPNHSIFCILHRHL